MGANEADAERALALCNEDVSEMDCERYFYEDESPQLTIYLHGFFTVLRMNAFNESFVGGLELSGLKPEHGFDFSRPYERFVGNIPIPTAHTSGPLGE